MSKDLTTKYAILLEAMKEIIEDTHCLFEWRAGACEGEGCPYCTAEKALEEINKD